MDWIRVYQVRIFQVTFVLITMLCHALIAAATSYKVNISYTTMGTFKDWNTGAIIKSSICTELPLMENATLRWDYAFDTTLYAGGKLYFKNGRSCDVDGVYFNDPSNNSSFPALPSIGGGTRQIQNNRGSYDNDRNQANCISLINQRTGALTSNDWLQLINISSQYINECKNTVNKEDISSAYSDILTSYISTGDYSEAYNISNKCIDVYYNNIMCHVNKSWSLIHLGRYDEATLAYSKSVKLMEFLIDKNNDDIANNPNGINRDYYGKTRDTPRIIVAFLKKYGKCP